MANTYIPLGKRIVWEGYKTPLNDVNLNSIESRIQRISDYLEEAQVSGAVLGKGTIIGDYASRTPTENTILSLQDGDIDIARFDASDIYLFYNHSTKDYLLHAQLEQKSLNWGNNNSFSGYCSLMFSDSSTNNGNYNSVLGQRGTVSGDENLVGGDNNIVEGKYNIVYTRGGSSNRETITIVIGDANAIFGKAHTVIPHTDKDGNTFTCKYNLVSGSEHEINGNFNTVSGYKNKCVADGNVILGYECDASKSGRSVLLGEGLTSAYNNQTIFGKYNVVSTKYSFILADGTADKPHNALTYPREGEATDNTDIVNVKYFKDHSVVDKNYNAVLGSDHTITSSGKYNVVGGNKHIVYGDFNVVGGYNNTINGSANVVLGYQNNSQNSSRTVLLGRALKAGYNEQIVVGRYNAVSTKDIFVVGDGTSSTPKNVFTIPFGGTPTKDTDAITLGYLKNYVNEAIGETLTNIYARLGGE